MTGGRDIFVKEVLGGAYDSKKKNFLRGDVDIDVDAIRHEATIVNDHVRMYFGPFCAGAISLFAFAGLVRMALRSSPLPSRARNWLGNACVIGFAFGSPLVLLLGNLSIYDEAIIWGLALSLGAIFFAFRSQQTEGSALTHAVLGFSLCAAGALLSRVTFGAPLMLIAPFLALRLPWGIGKFIF